MIYDNDTALEKTSDGIAESYETRWSPAQAEQAVNFYLLDPAYNEGDSFSGDRAQLIADIAAFLAPGGHYQSAWDEREAD